MVRTEEADKFCKLMDEVSAEADYPLHEAFCGGGANAVISQLAGTPTLDGLAPTSYRCTQTMSASIFRRSFLV